MRFHGKISSLSFFLGEDEGTRLFLKALKTILSDDSFKISSAVATEARQVAVSLLKWCSADANKQQFHNFANEIVSVLRKPIISSSMKSCNREVLWRNYFLQRSLENL